MSQSSEDASPPCSCCAGCPEKGREWMGEIIAHPPSVCVLLLSGSAHVRLCRCPRVGCDTPQEKLGRDLPLAPSCAVCHLAAVYITGNTGTTLLLSKAASLSTQRYLEGEKQSERQPLLFCFCQALKTLGKQKPDGLRTVWRNSKADFQG